MQGINGLSLLIVVFFLVAMGAIFFIQGNYKQIARRDRSPLQKAKKSWCIALTGSQAESKALEQWDALAIELIQKASTFKELDSAYEISISYPAYPLWMFQKKRKSSAIDGAFDAQHEALVLKKEEKKKLTNGIPRSQQRKVSAERPKRLPTKKKRNHFCSS